MTPVAHEVNFDGLVGPTHHYAGLSVGNLASQAHKHHVSQPREAALQGLAKMKYLADLGLKQCVLPPHERPDLDLLRRLGFRGTDTQVVQQAAQDSPQLLAAAYSASSMWAANAATVCPSADSADGRVHFTPANLVSELHRAIEPRTTAAILHRIFANPSFFAHHPPLPAVYHLRDEGAANHLRLVPSHGEPGLQVFVFGQRMVDGSTHRPSRYPARQSLEASEAIARLHRLDPLRTLFLQQHPDAIDAGVFHNDVIAVADRNILFHHAAAFVDPVQTIDQLCHAYSRICHKELVCIEVSPEQVSLEDAVQSYLFNSQLVELPMGEALLICPSECQQSRGVSDYLEQLVGSELPINHVRYVDVRQSMKNGGGPACLRLRVVLTDKELAAMNPGVRLTSTLYDSLKALIERYYRETLRLADLSDPQLLEETRTILDRLTTLLHLGSIYPFQL